MPNKYHYGVVRIDSIKEIDLDTVTLSDIYWEYGTGIATSTGDKRVGTYKSGYRNGINTKIGDIRRDIWRQVVEHIARRDGQEWLVKALAEWENAHNHAQQSQEDRYYGALFLYSHESYDNPKWSDFIPFNQKYRADVLKLAHIVTVVTTCCEKPFDTTQEQIDHVYTGIFCPHCRRNSTFFIVDDINNPPWIES